MPDFSDLLTQAKKMQDRMKETQEVLKKIEVEGISGASAVKIVMNGEGEIKKIAADSNIEYTYLLSFIPDMFHAGIT